jgi:hypothetical protein
MPKATPLFVKWIWLFEMGDGIEGGTPKKDGSSHGQHHNSSGRAFKECKSGVKDGLWWGGAIGKDEMEKYNIL